MANSFILVFGNIPNIFCRIFQGVSFNYHQRNVSSRVSVSNVQVSAFMAKSRSRSLSQVSVSEAGPALACAGPDWKQFCGAPLSGAHIIFEEHQAIMIEIGDVKEEIRRSERNDLPLH